MPNTTWNLISTTNCTYYKAKPKVRLCIYHQLQILLCLLIHFNNQTKEKINSMSIMPNYVVIRRTYAFKMLILWIGKNSKIHFTRLAKAYISGQCFCLLCYDQQYTRRIQPCSFLLLESLVSLFHMAFVCTVCNILNAIRFFYKQAHNSFALGLWSWNNHH